MSDAPSLPPAPTFSGPIFYIAAFASALLAEMVLKLDFFGWGGQFAFGLPVMIGGGATVLLALDHLNRNAAKGLVTTGPFSRTRNPVLVGHTLIYAGSAILLDTPLALLMLVFLIPALNQYVIMPEEDRLAERFGDDYRAYCASVKRWL